MSNISEGIKVGASAQASAIMNASLVEHLQAPRFSFDVQCFGPADDDREDYLRLLAIAERYRLAGFAFADDAARVQAEADAMVGLRWQEVCHNLVTNVGRNDVLDKYFKGSAYTAAWYLGLKGTGSAAAADTLASHAGWAEVTPYTGNRPAITFGTTSSQSNTATQVSYTINATATVAGAFIASVNTGTSGTLYSATDFAASRSVASGDTLNVTPTVTS